MPEALREPDAAREAEALPLRVADAGGENVPEIEGERLSLAVRLRDPGGEPVRAARAVGERATLGVCEGEAVALRAALPLAVVLPLTLAEALPLRVAEGTEPLRLAVTEALPLLLPLSVGEAAPVAVREAEREGEAARLAERLALAVTLAVRLKLRLPLAVVEGLTLALGSQAQQAAGCAALQLASTTVPPAEELRSARQAPAPAGAGARHHEAFVAWK